MMAPEGAPYYVDWVFSNNSNVHVANHRDWFTSYTPFKTQVANGIEALGIGTVETQYSKVEDGSQGMTCNILGGPILEEFYVDTGKHSCLTTKDTDERIALLEFDRLWHLRLHGRSAGQSSVREAGGDFYINARWSDAERQRYEAGVAGTSATRSVPMDDGYTDEEKAWLKQHYGNEFKFLRDYGLSIYKDEDREDGRRLLRGLMEEDEDNEGNGSENSFLAELEADPMSHLADYNFSDDELDWIKKHHGYSSKFMLSYGLKPYEQEDCDEAKSMIKAFMRDDEQ